jgi:AcrR family transcriptional regulator
MARPARIPAKEAGAGERIVAAAVELFALHGFEATTMRMLGDAVGLDNSSLYRHFAGKSEIANAVLDKTAADLLAAVAPLIDLAHPASLDRLEDIAAAAGLHFFDRPLAARLALHWIMSRGESGSGFAVSVPAGDVTRPSGKLMALLVDWLAKGARRGALRKHAMPEAIIVLFGAILLRPATQGDLLKSLEPRRTRAAARAAWEAELRAVVRGVFAP